jgi:hypothetical protein
MQHHYLRYMSCAGKRPFRRARDRRTFADVTAGEQMRKLKRSECPVDRMRPQFGLNDAAAELPAQQRAVLGDAPDGAESFIAGGRGRIVARSGRR